MLTAQQTKRDLPIRVILADDQIMFRSGLAMLFKNQPDMQLIGEAGDGEAALRLAAELKPDILLLDVSLSQMSGMEVLKGLFDRRSDVKSILLTASIERKHIVEAIQLGGRGLVMKGETADLLFKAIRTVMTGEYWIDRGRVTDLAAALYNANRESMPSVAQNVFRMTPREKQIVAAVVAGYTNRDIAEKLSISDQTVKNHLTSIFDKVGVSSRLELALCATKYHLDGQLH
jgi:DNA-binding NarL/FixJ family response regulator